MQKMKFTGSRLWPYPIKITSLPPYYISNLECWIQHLDFYEMQRWKQEFHVRTDCFWANKKMSFFVSSPFVEILFIFHNFAPAQIGTKSGPVGKMRTNLWQGANIFIILTGLASLWETPSLMSYNIWVISFIWVLLRTLCSHNIWCAGWK